MLTDYNPYNLKAVSGYESDITITSAGYSYSGKTESLITQMRDAIVNNTAKGYVAADIYTNFHANALLETMGQIDKFYPYFWGIATPTLRDPHPNQTGQDRIRDEVVKAFKTLP